MYSSKTFVVLFGLPGEFGPVVGFEHEATEARSRTASRRYFDLSELTAAPVIVIKNESARDGPQRIVG
jgi:hypothetical protein